MRPICTLLILLIYSCVAFTEVKGTPGISTMNQIQADSLAKTQVFYHGRVVPFHTVANDVTVKLTGKRKFRDLDPVKFTASLILFPSDGNEVPIFVIKDQRLADSLNVKRGDKIPMSTLFDKNGNYRLSNLYLSGNKNFDEALLDLDAKIETILLLRTNQLFQNLSESGANRVSEGKISLEIFLAGEGAAEATDR